MSNSRLVSATEHVPVARAGWLVAGVDVSGRTVGRTALAWLSGMSGQRPVLAEPPRDHWPRAERGDRELIEAIAVRRPAVVALDAPLELPHPVTCGRTDCSVCFPVGGGIPSYSRRQLERREAWDAVAPGMRGPMPMVMIAAIAFRAIFLRRALERQGLTVVETWPMGVYRTLAQHAGGPPVSDALDNPTRHLLLDRAVKGMHLLTPDPNSRDRLDAVAAAYAAWCSATSRAHDVRENGFEDEGSIVVPTP